MIDVFIFANITVGKMTDYDFNRIFENIKHALKRWDSLKDMVRRASYIEANKELIEVKSVPDELKIMCSN